jgi:hypothetical protein
MRNKRIQTVSLIFLFLILASPTYATLGDRLDARKDKMEARQEQVGVKKEDRQEARQAQRTDIAGKHADRLEQHFNNYFTRFTSLIAKIDARIAATTNKNTDAAKAKIIDAKAKLALAKTLGDKSIAQFRAIEPAKWPAQKPEAVSARNTANEAKEAFKGTLALMVETVKILKSAPAI